MPEAPQTSLPAHPGHLWAETSKASEQITQQLAEIQEKLDHQAVTILDRLDSQAEFLRELIRPRPVRKSTNLSNLLITYETPNAEAQETENKKVRQVTCDSEKSSKPSPTLNLARAGTAGTATPRAVPKNRRLSLTSKGTGMFTTFTEADLALRQKAAQMDARISRQRYADENYGVHSLEELKDPTCLQKMVQHPAFDSFFAMVVILNCFFIAFEVQDSVWSDGQTSIFLMVTQYTFSITFTIELALRFAASGWRLLCGDEWSWIILDLVIVASGSTEMGVTLVTRMVNDGGGSVQVNLQGFKAFRIIRVTRILKTLRLVRVFRFIMALRTLVTSIVYTLKSLFWAMALLMLIIFVFSVLLVEAVSDHWGSLDNPNMPPEDAENIQAYFASLPHAMLSLFMSISGGVSWEEVISPLGKISNVWVVVYLFYISFTYFAVLNVVTGVFCQSAIDSAQNDHANVVQSMLANKEAHVEKIKELFSRLGADKTGLITYGMFEEGIQSPAVIEYFETLGLDVWDAWSFFKLLDLDAGGSVEIEEFFKGCLRLRGQARGVDLGKLLHDQRWLIKAQGRFQAYVEAKLGEMCEVLDQMNGSHKLAKTAKSNFMRGVSPVNMEERCA